MVKCKTYLGVQNLISSFGVDHDYAVVFDSVASAVGVDALPPRIVLSGALTLSATMKQVTEVKFVLYLVPNRYWC